MRFCHPTPSLLIGVLLPGEVIVLVVLMQLCPVVLMAVGRHMLLLQQLRYPVKF